MNRVWQNVTGLLLGALLGAIAFAASATADDPDAFRRDVQPLLEKHCLACHGEEKQNAQLRYDKLTEFRPADRPLWTLIHEQLRTGKMPPADEPRPDAAEVKRFMAWIEQQDRAHAGGGTRRLNRRELAAALRDLTGLTVDFAAALPGDGKLNGFDTGADTLQDAADSVAQIMLVAGRAVDSLRFLETSQGQVYAADLRAAKDARQGFAAWGLKGEMGDTAGKPGTGLLLKPKWLGDRGGLTLRLPIDPSAKLGVLRLSVVVSRQMNRSGLPNPRLWVEVGGKDLDYREVTESSDQPRTLVYEVQLADVAIDAKGLAVTLSNRVEMPYAIEGFPNEEKGKEGEEIPGGTGLFRPLYDKKLPIEQQPVPLVVLHSIQIDPDYRAAWPPAAWQCDVGRISDDRASAERLLTLWIDRAWRRPIVAAERARFLALYDKLRRQDASFDDALRAAFQAVLLSATFRNLAAPGGDSDQYAIASRLSFMLWGDPPDETLRDLAATSRLRNPDVLAAQVERLLADPRSGGFVRPFVSQWLELGQPITIAMDHIQKQDFRFGRYLKESMHEETVAYVARMLSENRPARELLASDWAMMNDSLARHYGYEGIEGGHLRPVALRTDDPRGGGLLAQAGIQSMLCWMGENWVIYRGAWTLRHLLDAPPPPPPLEVPELVPSDGANHGKTFKELLRQHQEDDKCAVCHRKIDSLGFAYQNFDLSGRWRELEFERYATGDLDGKIQWRGEGKSRPVDAAGSLPRGEAFASFAECRELLVRHYQEDLVRGLLKNLVIYGAGRQPGIDDLAEIRAIMARQQPHGHPLKDLVKEIVRSRAFLGHPEQTQESP